MPRKPSPYPELRRRLAAAKERAAGYRAEGLPVPIDEIERVFEGAVQAGDAVRAEAVVTRADQLLARIAQDWGWLSELLRRVDGLRAIADSVGLDLARIDAQVGNPRLELLNEPLTGKSIEKAGAGASFALAVLSDAIPKYIVQEARALGTSIRRARDRGEEVQEAVGAFSVLLRSLQDPIISVSADRLAEARRAVARIPRAPAVAAVSEEEEDEILSEARNLARRLHRIKTRAHDATDAVRLISQVRQALAEDRRYASPEEEVEALWQEVGRLTKERRLAGAGPPLEGGEASVPAATGREPQEPGEAETVRSPTEDAQAEAEGDAPERAAPTAVPVAEGSPSPAKTPTPAAEPVPAMRSRLPMPIVPPVTPLMDEAAGAPVVPSPDTLADGSGPRLPRPTRIAIASAYVPPDLSDEGKPTSGVLPAPAKDGRRLRSRHRD